MDNEMKIFENEEFGKIREVTIEGEPWFVGKDISDKLGYAETHNMIKRIDSDDFMSSKLDGMNMNVILINESGLYAAILGSKLESAKRFKHWVTSEVLPSIRKHGVYAIDEVLANPDMLISALTELKEERAKSKELTQTVAVQQQQISEMQPKASYYDVILNSKDLVSTTVIAKDYGWTATYMNKYLHDKKIQYKQGNIWILYQKYAEQGYTSTKTHLYLGDDGTEHTKVHTYWTQKGRIFLYDLLKSDNVLPLMER